MSNLFTIEAFPAAACDGTIHSSKTIEVDKQVPRAISDDQQELLCFKKLRASSPSADKAFSSAVPLTRVTKTNKGTTQDLHDGMTQWQVERMSKPSKPWRRDRTWIELQFVLILRCQVHNMHRIHHHRFLP